jgi:hypothetical protein
LGIVNRRACLPAVVLGMRDEGGKAAPDQTVWSSWHAMPLMIIFWSRYQGASGGNI